MRIILCLNCLETGASPFDVGPSKGNQMDSYRDSIDLCSDCREALILGNFGTLAARHQTERTINVDAQGER